MQRQDATDPFAPTASAPPVETPGVAPVDQQPEAESNPDQTASSGGAVGAVPVIATAPPTQASSSTSAPARADIDNLSDTAEDLAAPDEATEEQIEETDDDQLPHMVPIRWTASEAIDHVRGKSWYIVAFSVVVVVVLGLAALAWFNIITLMTAISTGVLAVIMLATVLVVAKKPSGEIDYILTESGLTIAGRLHPFNEFRAFGVRRLGGLWQLVLIPVKRLGMSVTMFINEDQGEAIVDTLGAILPMEDIKPDIVDSITRKLKI